MTTPLPPPEPRPPRRYEIGASVGHGGSGSVFRAWDSQLRRFVALKRLAPADPDSPASYEQTFREAAHLAAAQHPNIVFVYDLSEDEEGPFMVMELVEGETLEAAVHRGPFPLAEFLELAQQSLEGLAAAHEIGLLHCDLKPANIMLREGPGKSLQVKLLDFGIASFATEQDQPSAPKLGLDGETTVLGTVEFMAPEQFEHARMTPQADLYSLGCIFFYTLSGLDPFAGATISQIMTSHLQHQVTPIGSLRPDLPPAVCDWLMRLICRSPAGRPDTAVQALIELKAALRGSDPP